ncbi:MAG: EAL domain-containing protein [Rivularia sp. (in: Bacteria)]|nr:EAL domain-containing protein [Rivularia sp. MS3]
MQKTAPQSKPEIYAFKEGYKIQLSKVDVAYQKSLSLLRNQINFGELKLGGTQQVQNADGSLLQFDYLPNFLEPFESFIHSLINQLSYFHTSQNNLNNLSDTSEFQILESIREASEADFVFVVENDNYNNCVVKLQSNLADNIDKNAYINILNTTIFPIISYESVFNPSYHGTYKINEYGNHYANAFAIIPLQMPPKAEIMVVCGLRCNSCLLCDAYGKILSSFYQSTQESLEPMFVEAAIIDALKTDFKFVSKSLYDRRFQLFCERLQKMVVYFEPVICIDANEFFISGWEALARDTQTLTAPVDLFQTAELWGSQFKIELDQYFLRVAAKSYKQARKSKQRRLTDVVPLSVNVYPESLISKAYCETVREIIKDNIISPRNLILEISEKSELPKFCDGVRLENPLTCFKNKLLEYVHQFNIRFAIDDFGVGHSSVSRLAGLNPCHVKIDREILHHQSNNLIINFVHQIVKSNNLYPPNVIVEGVDEETPISLYQLKEMGVTYVQGHIIGKPEPEVYRLSQQKYEELRKMILGE